MAWPKRDDGTNKNMGEMTPAERREQWQAAVDRYKARNIEIISQHSTQIGEVQVNFTVGRIK